MVTSLQDFEWAGAAGGAASSAAKSAAAFKTARYEAAVDLKLKWHNWLYKNPPNIPLLVSNVLYLALALTVLILTALIMQEHADDFTRNNLSRFRDTVDGDIAVAPKPCGMPTPDGMYLLQALGTIPAAGWDGASLEPNYQDWMQKIDRALCSKIIPGVPLESQPLQTVDCLPSGGSSRPNVYPNDLVEELLSIGYLMNDNTIMPDSEDYTDDTKLGVKNTLLEQKACVTEENKVDGDDPFYSMQQFDSYGDLKARVARAYMTAMPAFSRYKNERANCQTTSLGLEDPFDSNCRNGCHIKRELDAAFNDQESMYRKDDALQVPFAKQLYRLLALSLAGYEDRYHNDGACFRNGDGNKGTMTALEFCEESMSDAAGLAGECSADGEQNCKQEEAYLRYTEANDAIKEAGQCIDAAKSPPSPAPPTYRVDHGLFEGINSGTNNRIGPQVCAATLEYGLVEQGRLFGIPDVIMPFVVDNRVHRSFHFVAWILYTLLYVDPAKDGGLTFADPKAKLELYIAYRLASSSIWAILVANVAGFMMVRALVPIGIQALKFFGVMSGEKKMVPNHLGVPVEIDQYEPIRLMRPQIGKIIYATVFTTLLVVYWIMYLDPATQSHYYISDSCEDWAGLGVQVPSGAYVTTWGKRRFDRFGEHLIGILLILTVFVLLFQQFIGRSMISKKVVEDTSKVKLGATSRKGFVAIALVGFALLIQLFFILQSATSGQKWFDGAKGDDNAQRLGQVYAKDVLMSVWAAFWNSAAIGCYRQKWAITHLGRLYQFGWMAACVLLVWMPIFQAGILLDREIEVAFKNGKGSEDTERLAFFICIIGFSALWTGLLIFRLREVYLAMPSDVTSDAVSQVAIEEVAEKVVEEIAEAEEEAAEGDTSTGFDIFASTPAKKSADRFKFNLSGVRVGPSVAPARPQPTRFALSGHPMTFAPRTANARGERKSVYMPLLPRH